MNTEQQIKNVLRNLLGVNEDEITLDSTVDSLGMDSLDEVEFIMCLEERFDVDISDDTAETIKTMQDAVTLIEKLT